MMPIAARNNTHITRVQDSSIFSSNFRKRVAFVAQQSMHITYKSQVFLVSGSLAYGLPPFFNLLQYFELYSGGSYRRSFWESPHKLVEKLLRAYL